MTGNKKISQLVELTAGQVLPDDWLVIIDITSKESKKIRASELGAWLNESGSLYAIHADLADTASWAYNLVGGVTNALTAISASWASASISSSFAITAAYAASGGSGGIVPGSYYAIFVSWASSSLSSSWASQSFRSTYSDTASFLQYIPGGNNGTASYAITSQNVMSVSASWASQSLSTSYSPNSDSSSVSISASYAVNSDTSSMSDTASYLFYDGSTPNGTASYALDGPLVQNVHHAVYSDTASFLDNTLHPVLSASWADKAGRAISASVADYLPWSPSRPNNGTASYAIIAGRVGNTMNVYGMTTAFTQSSYVAIIDTLDVRSNDGNRKDTFIDVWGNMIFSYTASKISHPYLYLVLKNRQTGEESTFDSSSAYFDTTPVLNMWGNLETGSFNTPFRLSLQLPLYGLYTPYVITNNPSSLTLDTRPVKFSFTSYSDNLSTYPNEGSDMLIILPQTATASFYMTGSGPYRDLVQNMILSGSNMVSSLNLSGSVSGSSITDIRYTYLLETMSYFNCSYNPLLTRLDYMFPDTLTTFSCQNCGLSSIYDMSNTIMTTMTCSNNNLSSLPSLPDTLITLDCSNNPLLFMQSPLPLSMTTIVSDNTELTALPTLNAPLMWASFANSNINMTPPPFPNTLKYLNLFNNPLFDVPPMGVSCSYVNLASCSLNIPNLTTMVNSLNANGQIGGTLDIRGYGPFTDIVLLNSINALQVNYAWTVFTD